MSVTFDPYSDEDAAPDVDQKHVGSIGDSDPPVLKALSHIGMTFRQGGFCSPSPKRSTVKSNVHGTVSEESKSVHFADLAKPQVIKDDDHDDKAENAATEGPSASLSPFTGLAIFAICVMSSLILYFNPTVSNAFECQLNDIMASSKLYTFEIPIIMTILVSIVTMFYSYSNMKSKGKMIEFAWAIAVCIFISVAVYVTTKNMKSIGSDNTTTIVTNTTITKANHHKKNGVFKFLKEFKK